MNQRARDVGFTQGFRVWGVLILAAIMGLGSPTAAAAAPQQPEVTVMSRNVYVGASLLPVPQAGSPEEFVLGVGQIYEAMTRTDFAARAEALVDEIAAHEPDLIGLQEVARWQVTPAANPFAAAVSYDFLAILSNALAAADLDYTVARVVDNATIGPAPLVAPGTGCERILDTPDGQVPDCLLTFSDRDAILVRDSADLRIQGASSGRYAAQVDLPTAVGDLPVDRGWVAVDVRSQGRSFTFANTRLEAEDAPAVQEAQAAELLAGPGGADVVIAVGAFNSAADGSTTSTYSRLTAPDAFQDAWTVATDAPGATCCQYPDLTNLISQLDSRIDLVLTRGPIRPLRADVVGTTPSQVTVPRWASDHAGVVATLRLQ